MGRGGDLDQPWGTGGNIGGSGLYSTPAGSPADRLVGWVAGCAETAESVTFVCSLNGASLEPVCCKKQEKKFLASYWFVK